MEKNLIFYKILLNWTYLVYPSFGIVNYIYKKKSFTEWLKHYISENQ